ncbi:MAG TPA: T9SS type A sorting domain-containing protein [Fluviicola sp.]|nr:T9SS type A sorting domain-containing protein [Fluviicola sp.]
MKKLIYIVLFSVAANHVQAQNLVQNPGFEEYVPDSINGGNGNADIAKATHWVNVGPGTPDYFNSDHNSPWPRVPLNECGTQVPHGGQAYAGIYTFEVVQQVPNVREYIRTQLSSPLEANKYYRVSLFASLADSSNYAAIFGVNLSPTPINSFNGYFMNVPSSMQLQTAIIDKQNWTELSWIYHAQGGEQFLTIGGFTADAGLDTVIVGGDYPNAYYFIDDVSVTYDESASVEAANPNPVFSIYPNPANDVLTLQTNGKISIDDLVVTDEWGRKITADWKAVGNNSYRLAVENWAGGMYFISNPGDGTQRFIKR